MKHCYLLHRRGYADGEIEAMFAKYDIDGDRVLDEEEQRRMQADLFEQKVRICCHMSCKALGETRQDNCVYLVHLFVGLLTLLIKHLNQF